MTTFSTKPDDAPPWPAKVDCGRGWTLARSLVAGAVLKHTGLAIICLALVLAPNRGQTAPAITATKTDQLAVDNNSNFKPDPGDTLKYMVILTNLGTTDALGVLFSDLLDTNTTLLPGSVMTTPLALNDSYSAIGNVQITIPAPGVLANDADPDGIGPTLTVTPFTGASANGGNVTLSANGSFTYNPPRGFEGTDTFTYTLNDGEGFTDAGTVSVSVTGMIWFVTNSGPVGDGRLTSPFNSLNALASINNGAGTNPAAGDNIFLYSGSYTGPLTLLNNQKLIGQGATASLATITGLTPPPGSLALPATGGGRPTIAGANGVSLASGNTVRGLNLNATGGTPLLGANVGTLAVTEVAVTNIAGGAVNLANGTLSVALGSVSASGGANGIRLVNCGGSFAVSGDGALAQNGSGGTIQNTIGNGIQLEGAANVSLARMNLNNCQASGLFGQNLNGLVVDWCRLDSNGDAVDEGGIRIGDPVSGVNGLTGTAPAGSNPTRIANTLIRASGEMNVALFNNGGTLTQLDITNVVSQDTRTRPLGADGFLVEVRGNGSATVNFNSCNFSNNFTQGLQAAALGQSVLSVTVNNCGFTNNNEGVVLANANDADLVFDLNGNRFFNNLATGAAGAAIAAVNATTVTPSAIYSGKIRNNTINGGGIDNHLVTALFAGVGLNTLQVANNSINAANAQFSGIFVQAGETGSGNLNANLTVTGNVVSVGALGSHGIVVQSRITSALCAELANNVSTTGGAGLFGLNVRQRDTSTFRLPGFAGPFNSTAAVIAFLQGKNAGTTVGSTVATTYAGGAACVLPLLAAPSVLDPDPARVLDSSQPVAAESKIKIASKIKTPESTPLLIADDFHLTAANLQPILAAARQRWAGTGLTSEQLAVMDSLRFEVTDLAGWYLGASSGRVVQLDRRATGYGWFIDPTPMDDEEFAGPVSKTSADTAPHRAPAGRIDLLTTVLHEMGHAAGLADAYEAGSRDNLMHGFLTVGERRLPAPGQATGAVPGTIQRTQFVFTPVAIGTLPAGKSITLTFLVAINNPLPGGVCQLANQGTVSGSNFSSVLTDDPDTAAPNDPTVTLLDTVPAPTIAAIPANVCPNSSGNQASGPTGYAAYSWTIGNGTITTPANQPTITYTAGPSGVVSLGLTVFNVSGCGASTATNVAIVVPTTPLIISDDCSFRTNYFLGITFTDALAPTTMTMAFDGTNYWSCSGGGTSGVRLARYNSAGGVLATFSPGLDFRSIFTDRTGTVFARAFNDAKIYRQTVPGTFVSAGITLIGGSLDTQSSVVLNSAETEYVAMSGGVVSRWSTNGTYLGNVNLLGFGTVGGENFSPQNRGIAATGGFWLTYNGSGILSIWDPAGNRVLQSTLTGAGTSFDSAFSFSYCNGKVFVVDAAGGQWRGYDVCSDRERVAIFAAESNDAWNTDVRNKILGAGSFSQVDLFRVDGANPVPTLTDLQRYSAVLVYSDGVGFNNNVSMGNVLADFVDQGGGVVVGTFAFYNSGGISIQGRLVSGGYLPFTTAGQSSGSHLTLIKDLPLHPIFSNVGSFDGGTASYHNSPIGLAAGATLAGRWSNSQPLVGTKTPTTGRTVGLNFFPPSSDAASGFWIASTDGARLMANALLWAGAGRALPTIVTNPVNQVGAVGSFVTFKVAAVGSEPLSYQWRWDGNNLVGQTNNTLTLEVQPANVGNYSVVVSNPYGLAFSASASLGSQLRFLPPGAPVAGLLPLFIGSSDNCPLPPERAARIRVYATTNVALPFTSWSQLPNPLVLINGYLRVDALEATNPPVRFFRAVETP